MGDDPLRGAMVIGADEGIDETDASAGVAASGGVLEELCCGPVQATSVGGIAEYGLVAWEGVICGCGPEACRRELAVSVIPTVLFKVIREPVQRRARDAGRTLSWLLIVVPGTESWWAGSTRARTDAGQRAADALARNGRVGQGLL